VDKIYMDHIAGAPMLPEVFDAMVPYFKENFGNPSSIHSAGEEAENAITEAREKVASLIGALGQNIIFTSCGTESNNLALKGVALAYKNKGNHVIMSPIEHFSNMHGAKALAKLGFDVTMLSVDGHGMIDPDEVREAIKPETILVSIIHANPEVGTIQDLSEIGKVTKEADVVFHTDAVCLVGAIPVDVDELNVDLLSLAANMFYGPKGAAALYVRKGVRLEPLLDGGIQERGKRAGTENVPAIVGMGVAAEIAGKEMESRIKHVTTLRDRLIKELPEKMGDTLLLGHPQKRLPGNVSIAVNYIEGESMLLFLDMEGIQVASGSACISRSLKVSHVMLAMGIDHAVAQGSVLMTLGKDNTNQDVDKVIATLPPIVQRLRDMSPLYHKKKNQ